MTVFPNGTRLKDKIENKFDIIISDTVLEEESSNKPNKKVKY